MSRRELVDILKNLEDLLLTDPGQRGVSHLLERGDLFRSVLALATAKRVAITTGFPCFPQDEQKEETDGIPGALAIAQSATAFGSKVHLICDDRNLSLMKSSTDYYTNIGALQSHQRQQISISNYSSVKDVFCSSDYDCFVAIERSGRAHDGKHYTMNGKDITEHCDPIDDLFQIASESDECTTIGVGDGGNELGLGKVYKKVERHVRSGAQIGAAVAANWVVLAGVSNWGGYGLAGAMFMAARLDTVKAPAMQPQHELELDSFLPTAEQVLCNFILTYTCECELLLQDCVMYSLVVYHILPFRQASF